MPPIEMSSVQTAPPKREERLAAAASGGFSINRKVVQNLRYMALDFIVTFLVWLGFAFFRRETPGRLWVS